MVAMRKALFVAFFAYTVWLEASPIVPLSDSGSVFSAPVWGFFGHRRINRLATFTLPPEMMVFYKPNIDWIADHAVDADMRRYATVGEAPRHYIDLDNYGKPPFDSLPRTWMGALEQFVEVYGVTTRGDTVSVYASGKGAFFPGYEGWGGFLLRQVAPVFASEATVLAPDSLNAFLRYSGLDSLAAYRGAFFKEHIAAHGILPWHLQKMQRDLTEAFRRRDARRILRLSADIGHYVGDAHVPLHTTSNYNGAKTKQDGIHGFWESRIPELFADQEYDYVVGKAEYVERTTPFFWNIVLESHRLTDSVLTIEQHLRTTFPADQQMCPDVRNGINVITPCRAFAAAYQAAMNGMVERRLRGAVHALASVWFTAWVDAGQPNLEGLDRNAPSAAEQQENEEVVRFFGRGRILGRPESQ